MRFARLRPLAVLTLLAVLGGVSRLPAGQPDDPSTTGLLFPPWTHVRAATTGPITLSNPGTDAFDGVTLEPGDPAINRRLLVWQQEDGTENGLYLWDTSSTAMTRVTDLNESPEFIPHMLIYVRGGLTYRQSFFSLDLDSPPTLGTASLTYAPVGISVAALTDLLEETLAGQSLVVTDPDTGKLANPNVLPYPELLEAEPGPGSCQSLQHVMVLPQGRESRMWTCPNGASSNPVEFLGRPSLTTVCVGDDCLHCASDDPDCQLDIVGGAGLSCALTGTPPVMVVTCSPVSSTKSIWIPASTMSVSGGCSDPAEAALLTSGPKRWSVTCTHNSADSLEFDWAFTTVDAWNASTIQVQLYVFSTGNNSTEVFAMDFAGQCVRDGDQVAAHATTGEQAASVTFGNQTSDLQISALSSPITLNGACTSTSMVFMRGQVNETSSTLSPFSDGKILGVKVTYGID